MTPIISKAYTAGDAIGSYRIVAITSDETVVQANNTTATAYLGATEIAPATSAAGWTSGQTLNVVMAGIVRLRAGAAIAVGAFLTVNANGEVVTAAPAVGVNVRCVGIARQQGATGEIIEVLLAPFVMQG